MGGGWRMHRAVQVCLGEWARTHVGLDVAVDEGLVVDVLDALEQLVGDHQDRLQVELPARARKGQR